MRFSGGSVSRKSGRIFGSSRDGNYDDYVAQKQAAVARQWTEYESYTAEKHRLEKVYQETVGSSKKTSGRLPEKTQARRSLASSPPLSLSAQTLS